MVLLFRQVLSKPNQTTIIAFFAVSDTTLTFSQTRTCAAVSRGLCPEGNEQSGKNHHEKKHCSMHCRPQKLIEDDFWRKRRQTPDRDSETLKTQIYTDTNSVNKIRGTWSTRKKSIFPNPSTPVAGRKELPANKPTETKWYRESKTLEILTAAARLVVQAEDGPAIEALKWPEHAFARPWTFQGPPSPSCTSVAPTNRPNESAPEEPAKSEPTEGASATSDAGTQENESPNPDQRKDKQQWISPNSNNHGSKSSTGLKIAQINDNHLLHKKRITFMNYVKLNPQAPEFFPHNFRGQSLTVTIGHPNINRLRFKMDNLQSIFNTHKIHIMGIADWLGWTTQFQMAKYTSRDTACSDMIVKGKQEVVYVSTSTTVSKCAYYHWVICALKLKCSGLL